MERVRVRVRARARAFRPLAVSFALLTRLERDFYTEIHGEQ